MDIIDFKATQPRNQQKPSTDVKWQWFMAGTVAAVLSVMLLMLLPTRHVEAVRTSIQVDLTVDKEEILLAAPQIDQSIQPNIDGNNSGLADKNTAKESLEQDNWHEITVQMGDSLSAIFDKLSLPQQTMLNILNAGPEAEELRRIFPGHKLVFALSTEGMLEKLHYLKSPLESILFIRHDSGYKLTTINREPEKQTAYGEAIIEQSLFIAIQKAGLPDKLAMDIASIFSWDIDFALDIRNGDSFSVVYEELFLDGEKVGNGDVLTAQFTNRGKTFTAIRYTDQEGSTDYYTPDGLGVRKQFLRTPVDFARISSHFNLNRRHPILHKIRAHKGVDYAAARGTPIKASGDGKVKFAGKKRGYGNTIVLEHGNKYSTLYAHMQKFARDIYKGKRVKQGQIIGYVGSSGLATGPHLHYEFRVSGAHKNPLTVKLPYTEPINKSEKTKFSAMVDERMKQMSVYKLANQLALKENSKANKHKDGDS